MSPIIKPVFVAVGPPPVAVKNPVLGDLGNLSSIDFLSKLLSTLVTIALVVGGLAFLFMFLIGGINWITAGGDKGKLEEARVRIFNALIGLVVLFATWAIITAIEHVFGINILSINITDLII